MGVCESSASVNKKAKVSVSVKSGGKAKPPKGVSSKGSKSKKKYKKDEIIEFTTDKKVKIGDKKTKKHKRKDRKPQGETVKEEEEVIAIPVDKNGPHIPPEIDRSLDSNHNEDENDQAEVSGEKSGYSSEDISPAAKANK